MVYLIYGEESLIKKQIDNLLEKETNISIINYSLEEISVNKVLEDINTIDLFSNKKVIIVSNLTSLDNEDNLFKYLNNINKDNILIFKEKEINNKSKIIKKLKETAKVIDVSNTSLDDFIKDSLKDYKISIFTINLLKEYCNNNFFRIENELNKLKMLKEEEKEIEDSDVKKIVKKNLEKNIFALTTAINKKDKKKALEVYYDLKEQKEDEIKLIAILASNFRSLYKVKVLSEENSDNKCLSILNMHPYRFKILKEEANKYQKEDLLKYLQDLSNLDIDIKSGNFDKVMGMELFLSNLH